MENGHSHKERMDGAEETLKEALETSTLESFGCVQSGCINDGMAYRTDHGAVFVKFNSHPEGGEMFQGEFESLAALKETEAITVPKPLKLIKQGDGSAMLVIEYMDMNKLSNFEALGEEVARLHLHNAKQRKKAQKQEQFITGQGKDVDYEERFGFNVPTYAGYSRQTNTWSDSWVNFFARKMDDYVNLIERKRNDRDARPLWNRLVPNLPKLFCGICVEPALLHGDLWRGNVAQTKYGPVSFDPISLYGHSEFDLSIMFKHGGFNPSFFTAYHSMIPRARGFESRYDLYSLHHHFQIWSHFGDDFVENALGIVEPEVFRSAFGKGFKTSTLELLKKLDQHVNEMNH